MSRVFKPSRHGTDIQMGKNICDVCRAVVLTSSSPPLFADTVDLYVSPKKRVKVIDFNPWGAATLPLLFTWEELEEIYQSRGVNHDVGAVSETVRTSRRDFSVEGTNEGFECNGHTGANGVPPRHESGREVVFRVVEGGGGVQLGMRAASGVPLDLFHRGKGGPIDTLINKLREEDEE